MQVSVAICTWNRSSLLDKTLEAMHALSTPRELQWELLVVNNNCSDDTDAVISRYSDRLPIRRLFEPKQGLSNARNCILAAAHGDYLIWTDDDVLVDPHWLNEYAKAFKAWPEAAFFGGTIEPWFSEPPAPWILRHISLLEGPFAVRQLGSEVRRLSDSEEVFGANLAFRRSCLHDITFDASLGRIGNGMLSGDETDVVARLRTAGQFGVWVGPARVQHYIPKNRMHSAYVWEWYHGAGRTSIRRGLYSDPATTLFGAPRWVWRKYLASRALSWTLYPLRSATWLLALQRAATARGIIDESRRT